MNVENQMLQHYRAVYKMDDHGLETLSQEELVEIREEGKATCRRAFVDSLTEMMVSDPPAYDWIVKLYGEIRGRLIALLREGSALRNEIEGSMDTDLFSQMIRNDAFKPDDLHKLVSYTFTKCKELGSPARDDETDQKMQEIIEVMQSGTASFATVVPLYIVNINHCIDMVYEDLHQLLSTQKRE